MTTLTFLLASLLTYLLRPCVTSCVDPVWQTLRLLFQQCKDKAALIEWSFDPTRKHRLFKGDGNGDPKAMIRKAGWSAYNDWWVDSPLTPRLPARIPSLRAMEKWLKGFFPRLESICDLRTSREGKAKKSKGK